MIIVWKQNENKKGKHDDGGPKLIPERILNSRYQKSLIPFSKIDFDF